jgi:cell division protein FtsQ
MAEILTKTTTKALKRTVAKPSLTPAAPPAPERDSHLDRSTSRLDSKIPGVAGKRERDRRKPAKVLDQKTAALARTIASRDKAGTKAQRKGLSDNAKLLVALALLIAVGAALYLAVPVVTRVEKVSVNGMSGVTEAEVLEALALSPQTNLVTADLKAMENRIMGNPKISSVRIGRGFPDRLIVSLKERVPVACILQTLEIGTRSIALDANGVAFAYLDALSPGQRLPVISGIRFENFVPGQRLPAFIQPVLGDLARLGAEAPAMLAAFSEIRVEKISDSEIELLLFPEGNSIPIRMPAKLTKATLGSALLVLDILAGRNDTGKIEEIDFRTGTIVYRTKGAQPG